MRRNNPGRAAVSLERLQDQQMAKQGHGGAWVTFLVGIALVAALAIGAVVYLAAPPTPRLDVAITLPAGSGAPRPSPPPLPSPLPRPVG